MGRTRGWIGAAVLASSAAVGAPALATTVADYSFETPNVSQDGYAYRPAATADGAAFSGDSGVDAGAFGFASPPDGVQDGFIQSTTSDDASVNGLITLAVSGLTAGASYSVSFYEAPRGGYDVDPVSVSFDGAALGVYAPDPTVAAFTQVTTPTFTASADSGTLSFAGAPLDGDYDTGLDLVTVDPVAGVVSAAPEPSAWALMIAGVAMIGAALRLGRGVRAPVAA